VHAAAATSAAGTVVVNKVAAAGMMCAHPVVRASCFVNSRGVLAAACSAQLPATG
jgi:hypothetical protein